tara:strand:+ start:4035 stop:4484 length:450 start_codon:yes stop_codon:yes gene_type:complete
MGDTAFALGALASDLAFSVSFGIGRELLDAARDSNMTEDELVAAVLVLTVLLSALPKTIGHAFNELRARGVLPKLKHEEVPQGVVQFANILVDITRRICVSLAVQLLSANVRTRQTDRAVRIVSLISVAIFFLFLEATSSIATPHKKHA